MVSIMRIYGGGNSLINAFAGIKVLLLLLFLLIHSILFNRDPFYGDQVNIVGLLVNVRLIPFYNDIEGSNDFQWGKRNILKYIVKDIVKN